MCRIESGRLDLELEEVDLFELIRHIVARNQVLAERKQIKITLTEDDELPPIRVDASKIDPNDSYLQPVRPSLVCLQFQLLPTRLFTTMALVLPSDLYKSKSVATVSGMSGTGAGLGTIFSTLLIGYVADVYSFAPYSSLQA